MGPLIASASTFAAQIDGIILLIGLITTFWLLVAEGFLFWLIWRFRARPGVKSQYLQGDEKHVKQFINVPHVFILACDVLIIAGAMRVWYNVKQNLPEAQATVRVIGQQWAWVFQYPGADGAFDSADDYFTTDDLYVQADRTYHFQLRSRDVIHDFSVPVFRLKQDAVPGRTITGWFRATKTGTFDIQCAEICGLGHGAMGGKIHVQSAAVHAAWEAQQAASASAAGAGQGN
jgi:cytochrome c oxidase subunit 2